jgi:hypothetical protein
MMIYAIFNCLLASQTCDRSGSYTFNSLQECRTVATMLVPAGPDKAGRYYYSADHTQWFQCLGKHVDEWEAPR